MRVVRMFVECGQWGMGFASPTTLVEKKMIVSLIWVARHQFIISIQRKEKTQPVRATGPVNKLTQFNTKYPKYPKYIKILQKFIKTFHYS